MYSMRSDDFRTRAWLDPRLHTSSRRVLDVFLQRANAQGCAEMSYGTIARLVGIDRPHAIRCVKRLTDAEYLVREAAVDLRGAPLPNSYRLQLPE
jgi:DNA-binding IclR family transcriptional regulator